jgi:hypothetical protein
MSRVYQRRFDWDEARRRRAAGESLRVIAEALGVTPAAVDRVTRPGERERQAEYARSLKGTGVCDDCGGPMNKTSRYHGSTRCKPCAARASVTSVGEGVLRCFGCREWKPDEQFSHSNTERAVVRRARKTYCRACDTIARREYRRRNPEKEAAYDRAYKARKRKEQRDGS